MTNNNASAEFMVREDGTYPTVSLRKDQIVASVVQTRVGGVDGANPGPDIRRNRVPVGRARPTGRGKRAIDT